MWKNKCKCKANGQNKMQNARTRSPKGELTYTTAKTCATCNPLSRSQQQQLWLGGGSDADCAACSDSGNAKGKLHIFRGLHQHFSAFAARACSARGTAHTHKEPTGRGAATERAKEKESNGAGYLAPSDAQQAWSEKQQLAKVKYFTGTLSWASELWKILSHK